jgi:hypothetical protein
MPTITIHYVPIVGILTKNRKGQEETREKWEEVGRSGKKWEEVGRRYLRLGQ